MTKMVDGTQLYGDAIQRIQQLERLNKSLAEQVDRMRVVTDAASTWARNDKGFTRIKLRTAVINYESAMEKILKVNTSQ